MIKNTYQLSLATLALAVTLCGSLPALAQVAGGTATAQVRVTESTELAMGWSVKKTLLGKTIYNEVGQKVGKVDDLIISPDRNVSYIIVGAGGFIGMGRHDVAIPVTQFQDKAGKLVMTGATKEMIKAMPPFTYSSDTAKRDRFVAAAEEDIAKGNARLAELEKKAGMVAQAAKANIDLQITALKADVKSAESRLAELKQATAVRWKEFEAGVREATARVRKSVEAAID